MLIEPDRKLAHSYRDFLRSRGYRVTHVLHAQDAIFAADRDRPDVVVLEVQLAGHNGIEFLHEFRSYHEWRNIPVVILSLVPSTSLGFKEEMLRDFGVIECAYKPATTLLRLARLIDKALVAPRGAEI